MPESESPEPADAPTPEEAAHDESAQAALFHTNLEELQELKAREGNQAAKEQALRELLRVLDPHPQDHALAYPQVLGRLENVIARERQQAGG